jgi:hypothetical protein
VDKREDRRDRTVRYSERARREHLRVAHSNAAVDCPCEQGAWLFAKGKSVGCRCRRVGRNAGPKVAGSLCHGTGYHPCVRERIDGKRLTKAWLAVLRGAAPDEVEL